MTTRIPARSNGTRNLADRWDGTRITADHPDGTRITADHPDGTRITAGHRVSFSPGRGPTRTQQIGLLVVLALLAALAVARVVAG